MCAENVGTCGQSGRRSEHRKTFNPEYTPCRAECDHVAAYRPHNAKDRRIAFQKCAAFVQLMAR